MQTFGGTNKKSIMVFLISANSVLDNLAPVVLTMDSAIRRINHFDKFSISDNAILASSLVHWISVISHYTCV